jgi:putative colanic acid biosynthesis UDP-glucose lipid carrier transferase
LKDRPFVSESKLRLALFHRITDLAVIPFAAALSHGMNFHSAELSGSTGLIVAISIMIALWLYPTIGLYRAWRGESTAKELLNAAQAWTFNFLLVVLVSYLTETVASSKVGFFSAWYLCGLVGLLIVRSGTRYFLNRVRSHGRNKTHVIVVGDNGLATSTIRTLREAEWAGFNVLGYFGDGDIVGEQRLGSVREINQYLGSVTHGVDQIWIAMPLSKEREINDILSELRFVTQDVRLVPGLEGFRLVNNSVAQIADMPVLNLQASPMTGMNRFIKAVEDRVLAALILTVVGPLMLLIAVAIKLSSTGPVFYRQERVSRSGKPFIMYKFRSMPVNLEVSGVEWGGASDKVQNCVGRFLRRTSLDELPQFINVLLGDMSIVGPRPERTQFVDQFKYDIDGYMQKHMVKAGITGWAQVNGWRGDTDLRKRIECDLHYINNWSVGMDLHIIFLTVFKGWVHENAK